MAQTDSGHPFFRPDARGAGQTPPRDGIGAAPRRMPLALCTTAVHPVYLGDMVSLHMSGGGMQYFLSALPLLLSTYFDRTALPAIVSAGKYTLPLVDPSKKRTRT